MADMAQFYHAHSHTDFSLNDGIMRVQEAVDRCVELEQPALAITDHGTMAGCVNFYRAARRAGVAPILGVEGYLVADAAEHPALVKERTAEANEAGKRAGSKKNVAHVAGQAAQMRRHVLLLARSWAGYQALVRGVTRSHRQGYFKPLFQLADLDELGATGEVIMTTGCLNGEVPHLLLRGQAELAERRMRHYQEVFGPNYYVELQHHGMTEDAAVVPPLYELATRLGIPVIAAHDVHYAVDADRPVHDFFKRMAYKKEVGDVEFGGTTGYAMCPGSVVSGTLDSVETPGTRVGAIFADCVDGLRELRERCAGMTFPPLDSYSYVVPTVVANRDPAQVLAAITAPALKALTIRHPERPYTARWATELRVIRDTGFAQYFLFVRTITQFMEQNAVFFQARGSANGSLLCYLLGITQLDPLEWDLLFERFLSNDRSKPPDIDLDVEDGRRDEVLQFINRRFATTQIGTTGTYADKSAVNEVVAQLRREHPAETDLLEDDEVLDVIPEGRGLLGRLTGLHRTFGGHPAGVIAETPERSVADIVPLAYIASSGRWVTEYDMDAIELLGFTKVDVLGLRSLRTVRVAMDHLGLTVKDFADMPSGPGDRLDKATAGLFGRGETDGIFTYKGWSAKKGCQQFKPKTLEDLCLIGAMWRPSCLELELDQLYLQRRRDRWQMPDDWHPALRSLSATYGVAVYQEDIIRVFKALGFTPDDVMAFLRAVKKKDAVIMAAVRERLRGMVDEETFERVWELADGYTRYGFNKAHSAGYAVFGGRMGILKGSRGPLALMAALLETETVKTSQQAGVKEARRMGIRVLPADVQRSSLTWTIEDDALRRGLTSIDGVGEKAAAALIEARPFHTIEELKARVLRAACNDGALKKMAGAGAMRCLGIEDEAELGYELVKMETMAKQAAKDAKLATKMQGKKIP